ncbi:MAG: hypothetical protein ACR5LG_00100 [Sodalis sp. (in: enterobacteria)]
MNKLGFFLFNFTARTAGTDIYINADEGLLNNNVNFNCHGDLNIMMLTK